MKKVLVILALALMAVVGQSYAQDMSRAVSFKKCVIEKAGAMAGTITAENANEKAKEIVASCLSREASADEFASAVSIVNSYVK